MSQNKFKIKVPKFDKSEGFVTTEKYSLIMKKNISYNTKPEVLFRKAIWQLGYRYRINYTKLAGKPDIVFVSLKLAIFIDGDFWHGKDWKSRKKRIKSNTTYWIPKIERNIQRDLEVNEILRMMGWKVLRFWESEVKNDLQNCISLLKRVQKANISIMK